MPHYSGNISTNPDKAHFLTFVDVVLLHSSLTLSFSLSLSLSCSDKFELAKDDSQRQCYQKKIAKCL